jgi:hypothetical protein
MPFWKKKQERIREEKARWSELGSTQKMGLRTPAYKDLYPEERAIMYELEEGGPQTLEDLGHTKAEMLEAWRVGFIRGPDEDGLYYAVKKEDVGHRMPTVERVRELREIDRRNRELSAADQLRLLQPTLDEIIPKLNKQRLARGEKPIDLRAWAGLPMSQRVPLAQELIQQDKARRRSNP